MSETNLCSFCLRYVLGELCEFDKKRYERHLLICKQCQMDRVEYLEILEWVICDYNSIKPIVKAEVIPLFPENTSRFVRKRNRRKIKLIQMAVSSVVVVITMIINTPVYQGTYVLNAGKSVLQRAESKAEVNMIDLRHDAGSFYNRITGRSFDL